MCTTYSYYPMLLVIEIKFFHNPRVMMFICGRWFRQIGYCYEDQTFFFLSIAQHRVLVYAPPSLWTANFLCNLLFCVPSYACWGFFCWMNCVVFLLTANFSVLTGMSEEYFLTSWAWSRMCCRPTDRWLLKKIFVWRWGAVLKWITLNIIQQ